MCTGWSGTLKKARSHFASRTSRSHRWMSWSRGGAMRDDIFRAVGALLVLVTVDRCGRPRRAGDGTASRHDGRGRTNQSRHRLWSLWHRRRLSRRGVQCHPVPKARASWQPRCRRLRTYPTWRQRPSALPKWAVSAHVFQATANGSISPRLTAFANGSSRLHLACRRAASSSTDEDSNAGRPSLGSAAAVYTVAVHVTGYCRRAARTPLVAWIRVSSRRPMAE